MAKNTKGESNRKGTTVRLDPKLKKELRIAAAQREVEIQEAIAEGIALWLAGKPLPRVEDLDHTDRLLIATLPRFIKEAEPGLVELVRDLVRAGLSAKRGAKP